MREPIFSLANKSPPLRIFHGSNGQKTAKMIAVFWSELLLFAYFSLNKLNNFNNGNHNKSEPDSNEVLGNAYACKSKRICEERNLANERGCYKRSDARDPKDLILRAETKYASSLRAHIEAVEYLCHRHRQERHRHTVRAVRDLPVARLNEMSDELGKNGENGYENALVCDVHNTVFLFWHFFNAVAILVAACCNCQ